MVRLSDEQIEVINAEICGKFARGEIDSLDTDGAIAKAQLRAVVEDLRVDWVKNKDLGGLNAFLAGFLRGKADEYEAELEG